MVPNQQFRKLLVLHMIFRERFSLSPKLHLIQRFVCAGDRWSSRCAEKSSGHRTDGGQGC